ncbi:Helix-turn-helix [Pseudobutyrivibrio sp. JW11]|uniref:helix-turn-helix domain-containing protein n=1 Tax=Pseudobutyrivibrio sp. JW11 TaxID=1855302 RepID=UPI0008DFBB33|nr:helix-turn-helix transcriptional regulator [Pseudobutyrivibrio sp. JW11]SFO08298.1 Helix-turn-helix [Pseudobutyrivibrio sp. JW11]
MLTEINYEELGKKIKNLRIEKGLTQENLADYVGCNTSHISNIENSYTKLSLNVLLAIANALNVSVDYLLADQLNSTSTIISQEIINKLSKCNDSDKEKIIQIIDIFAQ